MWKSVLWYGMIVYGIVCYPFVCNAIVWYGIAWYNSIWYGFCLPFVYNAIVWYGIVWYNSIWYGDPGAPTSFLSQLPPPAALPLSSYPPQINFTPQILLFFTFIHLLPLYLYHPLLLKLTLLLKFHFSLHLSTSCRFTFIILYPPQISFTTYIYPPAWLVLN